MTFQNTEHGIIEGRRTLLTPVGDQDLDLLAGWFADASFVEHWGGQPLSRDEVAVKYLGRRRPQVESFLVCADRCPVGYAQYWHAAQTEGGIDMVLVPDARGQGYGPDAARALVEYLIGTRGWSRVTVDPSVSNLNAVRAWQKAGFERIRQDNDVVIMECLQ